MISYCKLAQSVIYQRKGSKFVLLEKSSELELIGEGRSAFAFRIHFTNKVLKVFFPTHINMVKEEAAVYRVLSTTEFYPTMYESGSNYLVIDYIEGNTMYKCLQKGIPILDEHIVKVEEALTMAKERGLNPSDIHLRNIIITADGNIMLIDVARFRQKKPCTQWYDLKKAYRYYGYQIFPKQLPALLLNIIAYLYKKRMLQPFL